MKLITREKQIEHPMEEVFDISPGTTVVEYKEPEITPVPTSISYDAKDNELDDKLETIYTVAMGSATELSDQIETVEGRYKARMGEVSATMLSVALGAVREKALIKQHKDKLMGKSGTGPQTINNNLVVADRNELMRMMLASKKPTE